LYILIDLPLLFITLKIILLTYSILNPPTFVKMSLSIMRTPNIRLSLANIDVSPRGTAFMLPIPDAKPELEGRQCWPVSFKDDYTYYLEYSGNRSVLTGLQRETCRYWLKNPSGALRGDTPTARAKDTNKRHFILLYFELQDNQVYRKSEIIKGKLFPARYAVCV
jgi:hypothetical protein